MKGILYGLIGGLLAWIIQEFIKIEAETVLGWMGHSLESIVKGAMSGTITETQAISLMANATRISSAIFSAFIGGGIGAIMGVGEGIYYGSKEKAIK